MSSIEGSLDDVFRRCKKEKIWYELRNFDLLPAKLFETRISLREAVCDELKIDCYSLLQPFAGTHGIQTRKLLCGA